MRLEPIRLAAACAAACACACGPADRANGGYVAGLLAQGHAGPLSATFRRAVRLGTDLRVERGQGGVRIMDGEDPVVEAGPATLSIEVPWRPDFALAEAAARNYVGLEQHPFPTCFVCGTERAAGDVSMRWACS